MPFGKGPVRDGYVRKAQIPLWKSRVIEPVVAASVIKVLIALAAESAFVAGDLDPVQPIRLSSLRRTPGPVGFSLFADDVIASGRDLVSAMLTISDNVATDVLLDLVGIEACNRLAAELGLAETLIVSNLAAMIESIAQAAGFADWPAMAAWSEAGPSAADRERRRFASSLGICTRPEPGDAHDGAGHVPIAADDLGRPSRAECGMCQGADAHGAATDPTSPCGGFSLLPRCCQERRVIGRDP